VAGADRTGVDRTYVSGDVTIVFTESGVEGGTVFVLVHGIA